MAQIRERGRKSGKTAYLVRIRLKGHPVQTATFDRLTDARKWAQDVESDMRNGRHFKKVEARRHTVADLVERFISELPSRGLKSARDYERQLGWWESQLGHLSLAELTPAVIVEQRDRLAGEVTVRKALRTPARVNRYLAVLSSALSRAVKEWQWLEDNPALRVSKLREPSGRMRYLSDDERERLLAACQASHNPDLYTVVVLALSTGARRMEVWGLCWPDVDLKRGMMTLNQTKNRERRSVPVQGLALELLRSRVRRLDTPLLFPSKTDPHRPFDFRAPFERARRAACIEDFRWHDLRHSCASYLAMSGVPMRTIAEILGHKSLSMTMRYSHLSPEHLTEAVGQMNRRIFGEAHAGA